MSIGSIIITIASILIGCGTLTAIAAIVVDNISEIGAIFGRRKDREIEKMKMQQEILELEIEKENKHIKLLEEENRKLDKIIEDGRP